MNKRPLSVLLILFIIQGISSCSNQEDSSTGITIDTGNVITAEIEYADGSIPDSVQLRIVPLDSLREYSRPAGDACVFVKGGAALDVSLDNLVDDARYFVEFEAFNTTVHASKVASVNDVPESTKGLWIRSVTKKEIQMILQHPISLTEMYTLKGVVDTKTVRYARKVSIVHTDIVADVSKDGYYEFTQVPKGSYTLLFLGSREDIYDWYALDTVVSVVDAEMLVSSAEASSSSEGGRLSSNDKDYVAEELLSSLRYSSSSSMVGTSSSAQSNEDLASSTEPVLRSSQEEDGESSLEITLSSENDVSEVESSSSEMPSSSGGGFSSSYLSGLGASSDASSSSMDSVDLSWVLPRDDFVGPWSNPYAAYEVDPYPDSLSFGRTPQFLLQMYRDDTSWFKLYGSWSQIGDTLHISYLECHLIITSTPLDEEIRVCPDWVELYTRFLWKDGKLYLIKESSLQQWI
ncbi:MAG: hypothetical protein OCD01_03260 [Fibrobacterales bacterium]